MSSESEQVSGMTKVEKWVSIVANIAIVAMLIVAFMELNQAISASQDAQNADRIRLTSTILQQGLDLEKNYQNGRSDTRDVVAFYYQAHSYAQSSLLDATLWAPLDFSLCNFLQQDPRFRAYWRDVKREYFAEDFVSHVNQILEEKRC